MRRLLAAATLLVALAAPSPALASYSDVLKDCSDGSLSKRYSQKEYAEALKNIPTDVDEYTDCRDLINNARLGAAGGGGGGSGSGGSGTGGGATGGGGTGGSSSGGGGAATGSGGTGGAAAPLTADQALAGASPAEIKAVQAAQHSGLAAPVRVGDRLVSPGDLGFAHLGPFTSLPGPLLVALILLALSTAGAGGAWVKTVVDRRRA